MPGRVFVLLCWSDVYQTSVGTSSDRRANFLLAGRRPLSFSNEVEFYQQFHKKKLSPYSNMQTKSQLIADGNWAHVNIFKSEWSSCGRSWGLSFVHVTGIRTQSSITCASWCFSMLWYYEHLDAEFVKHINLNLGYTCMWTRPGCEDEVFVISLLTRIRRRGSRLHKVY